MTSLSIFSSYSFFFFTYFLLLLRTFLLLFYFIFFFFIQVDLVDWYEVMGGKGAATCETPMDERNKLPAINDTMDFFYWDMGYGIWGVFYAMCGIQRCNLIFFSFSFSWWLKRRGVVDIYLLHMEHDTGFPAPFHISLSISFHSFYFSFPHYTDRSSITQHIFLLSLEWTGVVNAIRCAPLSSSHLSNRLGS